MFHIFLTSEVTNKTVKELFMSVALSVNSRTLTKDASLCLSLYKKVLRKMENERKKKLREQFHVKLR